ncbi:unnamed protein product [Chondrus crispus]|uniref:Uncharacterized protein n=1 Tax=Chondrus crispus TaxID=2769 RepID=R7Q2X9_CHOCR|nr:unnamed protein product [Chondrus crispus]CDF32253.1 unnamed protein product [Chondrus crispus]|eukprot:XP_005711918.1 unnamed protein product [Chondrus crispus]
MVRGPCATTSPIAASRCNHKLAVILISLSSVPCIVRNVIIDALGTFHYLDKFQISTSDVREKAPGSGTNEFVLVNVLRELLKSQKVIVFASKSALFEEEALGVKWPFSQAGIPSIPREFMPSSWRSISLHTVLLYFTADGRSAEAHERIDQRRGIVSLLRNEDNSFIREMTVTAASTIRIDSDGILENENDIHVVA